jgi:hypothetical protein
MNFLNGDDFVRLVVDELNRAQLHEHGFAFAHFELQTAAAADDLLGRDAIDLLRKGAHELVTAAGNDECLKPFARK